MPNGLALAIFLLVTMLFLAYIFSLIFNFFSPFYTTPKKIVKEIVKNFKLKPEDTFIDLGCGDGRVMFEVYRQYKCNVEGYEINPMPLIYFKLLKTIQFPFNSKIQIKEQNFFNADLSKYSVIYCCLPVDQLTILEKKFVKELTSGTQVYIYKEKLENKKGKALDIDGQRVYRYTY